MDSLRLAPTGSVYPKLTCSLCADGTRYWDRVAGKTYCPHCLESLALGEGPALVERTDRRRCAVCNHLGTIRYLTFPLRSRRPIEMDLCGEHLRALLERRLESPSFEQLRRQLYSLGLEVGEVFLLHDAFYDHEGKAIQPVVEPY